MLDQDRIILDILKQKSKFLDKRQAIIFNRQSLQADSIQETHKWNTFMNNSVPNSFTTHPKVNAIMELKAMTELIMEFNLIYSEKGSLISTYYEGQLDTTYNCVGRILDRFHIIQSEGLELTKKSHTELEYLLLIMKNLMDEFRKLIEKSYLLFIEETRKFEESEQLRRNEKQRILEEKLKEENQLLDARHRMKERPIVSKNDKTSYVEKAEDVEKIDLLVPRPDLRSKEEEEDDREPRYGPNNDERVELVFKDMWSSNRDYCHNIRKTVNNMCSQITSENPQHTIERLQQILSFLRGKSICLVGSDSKSHISLTHHPDAPKLFWYLFYQAVLIQAESQFAVNTDTTVAFASFAVALFGVFPGKMDDLLHLIFDHYPVFIGQSMSVIDDDHYFLALKGVARLLAALAVAVPPPNYQRSSGGLCHGQLWTLLAGMEAAPVQESVSAEAINGLLEMGGNCLWRVYGVQFEKMLLALKKKFEPLKGISEIALVLMIDDGLVKKKFDLEGYLSVQSWQC